MRDELEDAFARLAADRGAQILTGSRVTGLEREDGAWRVTISPTGDGRREGWRHTSRIVINSAGLWADKVAQLAGIMASLSREAAPQAAHARIRGMRRFGIQINEVRAAGD